MASHLTLVPEEFPDSNPTPGITLYKGVPVHAGSAQASTVHEEHGPAALAAAPAGDWVHGSWQPREPKPRFSRGSDIEPRIQLSFPSEDGMQSLGRSHRDACGL